MNYIVENLKTPVTKEMDVVVAGGGIAGVAAALSAARSGAKTILIEKEFMLGGLATAGLIAIYLPICDGEGRQVSFGIAEELIRLSIKHGHIEGRYNKAWFEGGTLEEKIKGRRFEVQYNPCIYAILLEELLLKEGVEILYGTSVCEVKCENNKITSVIVENKSGRSAINVKSVVDATGDADICHLSGAKCATYSEKNILAAWYYYIKEGKKELNMLGLADDPEDRVERISDLTFTGIDGEEISKMMCLSHKTLLNNYLEKKKHDDSLDLTKISVIPQLRMTRRMVGEYEIEKSEVHKKFDDSIGMFSSWRKKGPVYEVPFGCLYSKDIKNLLTAGRCISVKDDLWDLTRVIPVCAVTGEAAGTAAAMSDDMTTLDVKLLQKKLVENGVVLHEDDLK
ncbi:MAG: FAD-dependent oxidoreductase [Ruminococcaceae bacterium]|nr:FAD-dependent oxidoreductase [Oscillospiraceae bacterium]